MKQCINCGKSLSNRQQKYCSNACQSDYQYKNYIYRWKKGKENGLRGTLVSNYLRKYLLEKVNYKCEQCGWGEVNPFTGNVPLEIDHIDGNYLNNQESNLRVLCPNCHSLTSTYKGANKGKGRTVHKHL